jgi:hypothetical protein
MITDASRLNKNSTPRFHFLLKIHPQSGRRAHVIANPVTGRIRKTKRIIGSGKTWVSQTPSGNRLKKAHPPICRGQKERPKTHALVRMLSGRRSDANSVI